MTHSDKALETLRQLGTTPTAWALTPIDWVEEEREVMGMVRCPTCHGHKNVCFDAAGAVIPPPVVTPYGAEDHYETERAADDYRRATYHQGDKSPRNGCGNCPTCRVFKRAWGYLSTGKVKGLVTMKVKVGYPRWLAGTRFQSRFNGWGCCHLCNKTIVKSGRVPVNAGTLGMWVGEDCAKKFLAVKIKRAADSIMEDGVVTP